MRSLLGLLLVLFLAAPVTAAPARLDDGLRAHLAELPSLRNPLPDAADLVDRVVIVNFFASWCPPCHPEFQALAELDRAHRAKGLTVVSINLFEDWGGRRDTTALGRFLDRYDPGFPVLRAGDATADRFGGVTRIPTLFLFGRDGGLRLTFVHERGAAKTHLDKAELEAAIRAAFAEDD